jgi:hypothetical protein
MLFGAAAVKAAAEPLLIWGAVIGVIVVLFRVLRSVLSNTKCLLGAWYVVLLVSAGGCLAKLLDEHRRSAEDWGLLGLFWG